MVDTNNGYIKINKYLEIYPGFSFEEFKKTKYYKGQDGIRVIDLDEPQIVDNNKYFISLFFREGVIYLVSFVYCEEEISEIEEPKRKIIHDKLLMQKGIISGKRYSWGKIVSEYDRRSNISSIDIIYFNNNLT